MVKIDTLIFLALPLMVHTFISGARLFQSTTIAWERKPDQLSFSEKAGHNPSLRNLYMLYSRKGATSGRGNFLTYVNRAQCEFGVNEPIDQPVKNHMVKIRKRLNS
jgi:hypothetical protein